MPIVIPTETSVSAQAQVNVSSSTPDLRSLECFSLDESAQHFASGSDSQLHLGFFNTLGVLYDTSKALDLRQLPILFMSRQAIDKLKALESHPSDSLPVLNPNHLPLHFNLQRHPETLVRKVLHYDASTPEPTDPLSWYHEPESMISKDVTENAIALASKLSNVRREASAIGQASRLEDACDFFIKDLVKKKISDNDIKHFIEKSIKVSNPIYFLSQCFDIMNSPNLDPSDNLLQLEKIHQFNGHIPSPYLRFIRKEPGFKPCHVSKLIFPSLLTTLDGYYQLDSDNEQVKISSAPNKLSLCALYKLLDTCKGHETDAKTEAEKDFYQFIHSKLIEFWLKPNADTTSVQRWHNLMEAFQKIIFQDNDFEKKVIKFFKDGLQHSSIMSYAMVIDCVEMLWQMSGPVFCSSSKKAATAKYAMNNVGTIKQIRKAVNTIYESVNNSWLFGIYGKISGSLCHSSTHTLRLLTSVSKLDVEDAHIISIGYMVDEKVSRWRVRN